MAAGLGFKTFTTGEVLTAADTNGYLMQGVLVFASSAARAAAVTSPQEGQYSYLKDTNSTEYYDGAAWIAAPIGDITGVTAGTGISGGGTSGTVTVTNSMATEITAAGDIIVGTGSGTFDNLPIGTTAQVLTADTTVSPYKVKWATPASGSYTSLATGSLTGSSVSITSISGSYKELILQATGFSFSTSSEFRFTINSATSQYGYTTISNGTASGTGSSGVAFGSFGGSVATYNDNTNAWLSIPFYATASRPQWIGGIEGVNGSNGAPQHSLTFGGSNNSAAVTSIQLFPQTGTFSSGTYTLWGVA